MQHENAMSATTGQFQYTTLRISPHLFFLLAETGINSAKMLPRFQHICGI
jgi:hypothetical protein